MAKKRKKDNGWVRIHRNVTNNPLWFSEPFTRAQAWIDLILMVNHSDRRIVFSDGTEVVVHEGQHFTSINHLAERWKWSRTKVNRFLSYLADHQMIHQSGTRRGTLITLINWAVYQHGRTPADTSADTSDDTPVDTSGDTQTIMLNNNDNNNNVKQGKAGRRPLNSDGEAYE